MLEHSVPFPAPHRNAFPRARAREGKRDQGQGIDIPRFIILETANNSSGISSAAGCGMGRTVETRQPQYVHGTFANQGPSTRGDARRLANLKPMYDTDDDTNSIVRVAMVNPAENATLFRPTSAIVQSIGNH